MSQEDRQDGLGDRWGNRMNCEESDDHVDENGGDLDLEKSDGSDRQKNRRNDVHRDRQGQHQLRCGYEHGVILIDEKGQMME